MTKHIYRGRARYEEVDPMKHVHNARYYVYFEEARTDLARANGFSYSDLEDSGIIMPLTESKAKFVKPIRYDETFTVEVSVEFVRNMSMKFLYEIKNEKNELVCFGYTVHAFLDAVSRDFAEIPGAFRDILTKYLVS